MSLREALIMALIVVLGLTGVIWFLSTHEQVTEQAWTGFRGEARRNPWLAAQRLVGHFDKAVKELRTLPEVRNLPSHATLIVPKAHHTITGHLRDEIIGWVRQGGYLIVEAEYPQVDDPLTEAFGVERYNIESEDDEREVEEAEHNGRANFTIITLPNAVKPARVWLDRFMSVDASDAWYRADGKYGAYLLAKRSGRGAVTVINDLDFARNNAIGKLDHAQFILDLVNLREKLISDDNLSPPTDEKLILFFNKPGKPSLLVWLRENAWAPLAGAAVALLFWLWQTVPRFGPIMPDIERHRRRLLDHLRASGRFLWSNGHATRLLEASRDACVRQVARSLPHFLSTPAEARPELLIHALGVTQEQAQRILQPQKGGKMLQFWQTIRLYQRVYSRLAGKLPVTGAKPR